jgi:hypothetical protein
MDDAVEKIERIALDLMKTMLPSLNMSNYKTPDDFVALYNQCYTTVSKAYQNLNNTSR